MKIKKIDAGEGMYIVARIGLVSPREDLDSLYPS